MDPNILNIKWAYQYHICIKQYLSNIWSSIHENVKQHWGCVEKKLCLEKSVYVKILASLSQRLGSGKRYLGYLYTTYAQQNLPGNITIYTSTLFWQMEVILKIFFYFLFYFYFFLRKWNRHSVTLLMGVLV